MKENKGMTIMVDNNDRSAGSVEPVVIKKYANRRLYNTETSSYVTLDDLARMVRSDRDFVVRDAKSGEDLTHSVLTQIIVEQEGKEGGPTLLPIPFLRQLIRYYDDNIGKMVPSYLQFSMDALAKEHERYRAQFANWGPNAFEVYQEQARKNLAMFEQAFAMWAPGAAGDTKSEPSQSDDASTAPTGEAPAPVAAPANGAGSHEQPHKQPKREPQPISEIDELKAELAAMQAKIERISRSS